MATDIAMVCIPSKLDLTIVELRKQLFVVMLVFSQLLPTIYSFFFDSQLWQTSGPSPRCHVWHDDLLTACLLTSLCITQYMYHFPYIFHKTSASHLLWIHFFTG